MSGVHGESPRTNRLIRETSPYLLQHAHNPVDWFPWGEEAFAKARSENKPIFLSIGYAACHWCHVMERESFNDEQLASYLNAHFVPIKVDREERPDVDGIYITALLAINGQAGWPASLFLWPDLRPFAGGTYFPPEPRQGMSSFLEILMHVHQIWQNDRASLDVAGNQLRDAIANPNSMPGPEPGNSGFRRAVHALVARVDAQHGGFSSGQKFPQCPQLELLLLGASEKVAQAHERLRLTLNAIDAGGLQDHLGGGFHRYCVDREWTVPHFEKMLFDNAQLLRIFVRSSSIALSLGDREASRADLRVVRDTAHYLLRDLFDKTGLVWSSEDADDPGGEGHFYTFTAEEARTILGDGPLPYGISTHGNFENGRNVLTARTGRPSKATRERLLEARNRRKRPAIDTKHVVAWNGLALGALAEAGRLFGSDDWISAAKRCANAVLASRTETGLLPRLVGGNAPGILEDQAFVADALLDLYQADPGNPGWLEAAANLAEAALHHFWDAEQGGFFQTQDRPDLLVRRKELQDGAEPSGAGRMAEVLRRLELCGHSSVSSPLRQQLAICGGFMERHGFATPELWGVARGIAAQPRTLVIAGAADHPITQQFLMVWNRTWRPHAMVGIADPRLAARFPWFDQRSTGPNGAPIAYLCRQSICERPIFRPEDLAAALGTSPVGRTHP